MRGLFSEITKDRNKKKAKINPPKNLSTQRQLGGKGGEKIRLCKLSRSANKLTNSVVTLLYILAYKSINSYSNAIT